MAEILLIDNSNIFIGLTNQSYLGFNNPRFDYLKFVKTQFNNASNAEKILVGSTPPSNDGFWTVMRNNGFTVKTFERGYGKEKKVDTEIVAQGIDALNKYNSPGRFVLMSGDSDMEPLVNRALDKNWQVELWTWYGSIKHEYAQTKDITVKYIDDFENELIFHEPDRGVREYLGEYKIRVEQERIAREAREEQERIARAAQKEQERFEKKSDNAAPLKTFFRVFAGVAAATVAVFAVALLKKND